MERRNDREIQEPVWSRKIKAGKRTYFIDCKASNSGNDYYLTITESKKKFNGDGFQRHKIFLYKEDFNKFQTALDEAIGHIKNELLPEFDYDSFNSYEGEYEESEASASVVADSATSSDDDLSW